MDSNTESEICQVMYSFGVLGRGPPGVTPGFALSAKKKTKKKEKKKDQSR